MATVSYVQAGVPISGALARWSAGWRVVWPLLVIAVACVLFRLPMAHGPSELVHRLDPELLQTPWKLLLPIDFGGERYRWAPTGYVLLWLINLKVSAPLIFVGVLAVLVVASYLLSYAALRSRIFSGTLAICMGFGSQFNYSYIHNGGHHWVLFTLYLLVNLFFLHALATQSAELRWPRVGFVVSLIVFALCWEQWLDYLAFLLCGCLLAYLRCRRDPQLADRYRSRIRMVAISSSVIAAIYLVVRLPYSGEHVTSGHESDTIFTYSHRLIALDDLISNGFTYLYIAVTNFCPSWFNGSNSLYHVGADAILREQDGYHPQKAELVVQHHLFLWYFYAGTVFVGFAWLAYRSARQAWTTEKLRSLLVFALMLLIATGFATHTIIKFRPYLSVPLLAYKCIVSVTGMALLVAFGVMRLADWMPGGTKRIAVVAAVWICIAASGVERFSYHSQLARHAGLGEYPDPVVSAKQMFRRIWPRHGAR